MMRFTKHEAPCGPVHAPAALLVALAACATTGPAGTAPTFATPEEAVQALVLAVRAPDPDAILDVLGPDAEELVHSGDPVADEAMQKRFLRLYDEGHALVKDGADHVTLEVGATRWPFTIPLVRAGDEWLFDVEAGRQEVLARRIGRNELATIQSCLAYVDAQREYYTRNPDGDALLHYAAKLRSTPGRRDGLYWETPPAERPSPLGALFAEAQAEGYTPGGPRRAPYHGYNYRALTAQGPHAVGGAYDYRAHGELLGGFAAVAWPADYGNSGVMTFLVNQDGVVYEKDLGPDTATIAAAMETFDPDPSWTKAE